MFCFMYLWCSIWLLFHWNDSLALAHTAFGTDYEIFGLRLEYLEITVVVFDIPDFNVHVLFIGILIQSWLQVCFDGQCSNIKNIYLLFL